MKLAKFPYDPAALADFFQEGLESLGALCERTWHDQLHVVAEGAAAKLWQPDGQLLEKEIRFPLPDDTAPRQADEEVFPGCPLTFRLAEALNPPALALHRAVAQATDSSKPPTPDVAEKMWRLQFPGASHWQLASNFRAAWHFSLVVLARCEIQAIDQHWSLHRLALSLADGQLDEALAQNLEFLILAREAAGQVPWPAPELAAWQGHVKEILRLELAPELAAIRQRQENYLRRELDRIDHYFENYARELKARLDRQHHASGKSKHQERLAAAQAEHERRRLDQIQRHEIRVIPHLDALLLLAEPAWRVAHTTARRTDQPHEALFIPRTRRWLPSKPNP